MWDMRSTNIDGTRISKILETQRGPYRIPVGASLLPLTCLDQLSSVQRSKFTCQGVGISIGHTRELGQLSYRQGRVLRQNGCDTLTSVRAPLFAYDRLRFDDLDRPVTCGNVRLHLGDLESQLNKRDRTNDHQAVNGQRQQVGRELVTVTVLEDRVTL